MRLIFIRHAEPIPYTDMLTEKGKHEAEILSDRVSKWKNIKQIYCSPMTRTQMTAAPSLKKLGREAITLNWLREFEYLITSPSKGIPDFPWDLYPDYYSEIPEFYDINKWLDTDFYSQNPDIRIKYGEVFEGIDSLVAKYGYVREGHMYIKHPEFPDFAGEEEIILCFTHFGASCMILSHLLNIPAPMLLMHFVNSPTGIICVNAETRSEESGGTHFRLQFYGDIAHLRNAGEPVSTHAAFSTLFNG